MTDSRIISFPDLTSAYHFLTSNNNEPSIDGLIFSVSDILKHRRKTQRNVGTPEVSDRPDEDDPERNEANGRDKPIMATQLSNGGEERNALSGRHSVISLELETKNYEYM